MPDANITNTTIIVKRNIFGNKNALIGTWDLAFGALYVLGAFVFRKTVANDMLDTGFSVIGASAGGCLAFIIFRNIFVNWSIKYPFIIGLGAWLVLGFLLAPIIGDGFTDGSGGSGGGEE